MGQAGVARTVGATTPRLGASSDEATAGRAGSTPDARAGRWPSTRRLLLTGRQYLLVFLVIAGLVVLAVWPWPRFFVSGLPDHWDPPLHAWKLAWNVEHIWRGQLFRPDYNANAFYPFSYTAVHQRRVPRW